MIQRIFDTPWVFISFVLVLVIMYGFSILRIRRDNKLKNQSISYRGQVAQPQEYRRRHTRSRKKLRNR